MTIQLAPLSVFRRPAETGRSVTLDPRADGPLGTRRRRRDEQALRVLFVGNGLDRGWGVGGHRAALTTDIARDLRAITGRVCELDVLGDAGMDAAAAIDRLATLPAPRYDAAVVAIGAGHAMRLTPAAAWGARIVDLVTAVQAALPAGAPVLLVGTPAVHVPKRVQALNPIALRHAARLDRVALRLAEVRAGVRYLPAPALAKHVGRRGGGDLAAAYSLPVAAALTSALRDTGSVPADPRASARLDRLDLRALVDAERTDALAVLTAMMRRAADEFEVAEAALSLFDGERRWRITSNGSGPADPALALTYCETVVCTDDVLVVPDGERDARFAADARLGSTLPAFYAGVPVHAEDGTAIGAMCVLESLLRSPDSVDLDRLREFAHDAEAVLRAVTAAAGWLAPLPADPAREG